MIAAFSVRLAQAAPRELNATIAGALGEMADFLGAERAYLVLSGGAPRTIAWRKPGSPFPGGWPERAPMLAAAVDQDAVHQGAVHQDGEGVLHVRRARDLFAGDEAAPFREAGLTGWACAWRAGADGGHWLLGFDALHRPLRITQAGELNLLRVALDAVANAVGRQSLEEERERLEAQLQQARRMETVGALASGIAHNFNNVIGAIMGHAEMAEAQAASAGRESGNIAAIRRAGQRAGELVEQILAFARPRDVPRTAIGVASSVREAASLLHASLPPGTELVIGALAEEALVRAAPAQLQQVILNLCINASQAMQGTGSVKVEARVQDLLAPRAQSHGQLRQGRYACIAVTDSGPGMDAATLGRIFEPFVTSRADGNGLGLTTVREIVREYGGAMHVESAPGAGSRFEAWLPCLAPPSLAVVAGAAAGPMPAPPLGRGDTLLVVNEDRTQLLRDEEILAALGYEPVGFADKEDALAACRAAPGRFRAAVVARVFTKEAAIALVAELHRILPSLPIVLAAPFCGRVDAKTLVGIGLSEVVSAPIAPAEIASALARALPPSSE
jgi:signal transduction histidine kinase